MSSQCYNPVLFGSAQCNSTWPNGGYCSSTCFRGVSGLCGGFGPLATGYCTSAGVCLAQCTGAGTGQANCRSGYLCDFNDADASESVCKPDCRQVPCTSGTCQSSGYCR